MQSESLEQTITRLAGRVILDIRWSQKRRITAMAQMRVVILFHRVLQQSALVRDTGCPHRIILDVNVMPTDCTTRTRWE